MSTPKLDLADIVCNMLQYKTVIGVYRHTQSDRAGDRAREFETPRARWFTKIWGENVVV